MLYEYTLQSLLAELKGQAPFKGHGKCTLHKLLLNQEMGLRYHYHEITSMRNQTFIRNMLIMKLKTTWSLNMHAQSTIFLNDIIYGVVSITVTHTWVDADGKGSLSFP